MITDTEVQVEQVKKNKKGPKEPGRFCVIFHNDDMTPMDFVAQLLETIFHHDRAASMDITLKVHNEGRAVVGVYSFEIAEQKALEAVGIARNNGFPLAITVEAE